MTAPSPAIAPAAMELAQRFHDTYERLAPEFGYETRADTRTFDPESPNGRLMIAVCRALLAVPEAAEDAGCAPFLKDGETPAQCIARNRADIDALLTLHRRVTARYQYLRRELLGEALMTTQILGARTPEEVDAAIDAAIAAMPLPPGPVHQKEVQG